MSYLYSKLPETGVSPHIGTGGSDLGGATKKPIRDHMNHAMGVPRWPWNRTEARHANPREVRTAGVAVDV